MKLKAIRAAGVGPFRTGVAIEGLSGALDVLTAPNEAGKSTLFRAVQTVFAHKHGTTDASVLSLLTDPTGSAHIEVDFDVAGQRWRIAKSYGRTKRARLTAVDGDGAAEISGAAAEERLAAIVGSGGAKLGPLGFLWVAQGDAQPRGPDDRRGESSALRAVIEREVAEISGAARLRRLRNGVQERMLPLCTAKQRQPVRSGPWGQAIARRDRLASEHSAAVARQGERAARRREFARLVHRRDEIAAADSLGAACAILAAAEVALSRARDAHEKLRSAEMRLHEARGAEAAADAAARSLREARKRVATLEIEVAEHEADLVARRGEAGRLADEHQRLCQLATGAQDDVARLTAAQTETRRRIDGARRAAEVMEQCRLLAERLSEARALEARIAALANEAAGLVMPAGTIDRLTAAETELHRAMAALEASAPTVEIDYEAKPTIRFEIDGTVAADGRQVVPADRAFEIIVPGVGTIRIAAANDGRRQAHVDAANAARTEIADTLTAAGVATSAEARDRAAAHAAVVAQANRAGDRLDSLAPAGLAALAAEHDKLASEVAGCATGTTDASDVDALQREFGEIDRRLTEASAAARRLQADASTAGDAAAMARQAVSAADATLAIRCADLQAASTAAGPVANGGAVDPLDDLMARADRAREHASSVARNVMALAEVSPDAAAVRAAVAHREGSARALQAIETEIGELDVAVARLEGELDTASEAADDDLDRLAAELASAEAEVEKFASEVGGLLLLADELDAQASAAQCLMQAPVVARLRPYLDHMFPGAIVDLDADLGIAGIDRAGTALPITKLSSGAREQIAILVRLAHARLLADGGQPLPVVLDDALVYSDDRRIAGMAAALVAASVHHQVLVLSCRDYAFAGLGGVKLEMSAWDAPQSPATASMTRTQQPHIVPVARADVRTDYLTGSGGRDAA
jgi:predicted  nucleic acid-binding Zn-ribbon protein